MRKIWLLVIVALMIALLIGCENETENSNINKASSGEIIEEEYVVHSIYKEYDTSFDIKEAFANVFDITGLEEKDIVSNAQAEEWYKISAIKQNGYEIRKNNNYEIAIIKLADTDQCFNTIASISSRMENIGANESNSVIELNSGVITFVFGNDARSVTDTITKVLKEM